MSDFNVHTVVELDASASAAWHIFGEKFADWSQWADGITASSLDRPVAQGAMRTNETTSLGRVTQELTEFDPGARALTYEMREGMPGLFKGIANRWTIEPLGADRCRISGEATFGLAWWATPLKPLLRKKMTVALEGFASDFEARIRQP